MCNQRSHSVFMNSLNRICSNMNEMKRKKKQHKPKHTRQTAPRRRKKIFCVREFFFLLHFVSAFRACFVCWAKIGTTDYLWLSWDTKKKIIYRYVFVVAAVPTATLANHSSFTSSSSHDYFVSSLPLAICRRLAVVMMGHGNRIAYRTIRARMT